MLVLIYDLLILKIISLLIEDLVDYAILTNYRYLNYQLNPQCSINSKGYLGKCHITVMQLFIHINSRSYLISITIRKL